MNKCLPRGIICSSKIEVFLYLCHQKPAHFLERMVSTDLYIFDPNGSCTQGYVSLGRIYGPDSFPFTNFKRKHHWTNYLPSQFHYHCLTILKLTSGGIGRPLPPSALPLTSLRPSPSALPPPPPPPLERSLEDKKARSKYA